VSSPAILVRFFPRAGPGFLLVAQRVFLLAFPLRALLEKVLASLALILAPPARGVWPSVGPMKVMAGEAASGLELVETGGEALVGSCRRRVRFLLDARAIFSVAGLASLVPGLRPFFSEKTRLKLARELGSGKRLFLTIPCGSVKLDHSTP